jgi:hypothetical protein
MTVTEPSPMPLSFCLLVSMVLNVSVAGKSGQGLVQ